jgi:predicted metal-dependent hydrolase
MKAVMKKRIQIGNREVEYDLKVNARARSIRLAVHPEKGLQVTLPKRVSKVMAEKFIVQKSEWILKYLERFKETLGNSSKKLTVKEIKKYKEDARSLAAARLAHFNSFYNFSYNTVSIKAQKTRWGSCSRKKNLNFNYKIALLPLHLTDYIIVHELCHLAQMNHSAKFWTLVAQTIPDHTARRKELRSGAYRLGQ